MEKYFIASNSSDGFCSYYDKTFVTDKFRRIIVIKGGSGTGKAFFMKEIARIAEEKGFEVRYIYCSSDASSLDAIIINELNIAVLDGTAPHVYEPKLLGAVESLVDLGGFLDEKMLRNSRSVIESIIKEKTRGFQRAYRNLLAYRKLSENIEDIVRPHVRLDKIKQYASRFAENVKSELGVEEHLLTRSIGMRGISSFDTYFQKAKVYYEINDYFESAHFMMREIYSLIKSKKCNMSLSNDPIIPTRLTALRIEQNGLTFEIGNEGHDGTRLINMKRFINGSGISDIRQEYRRIVRLRDEVLELALAEFERIKKYHFILEEIYGSAMDFDAKEEFTHAFCHKIFENN